MAYLSVALCSLDAHASYTHRGISFPAQSSIFACVYARTRPGRRRKVSREDRSILSIQFGPLRGCCARAISPCPILAAVEAARCMICGPLMGPNIFTRRRAVIGCVCIGAGKCAGGTNWLLRGCCFTALWIIVGFRVGLANLRYVLRGFFFFIEIEMLDFVSF